MVYRNKEGYADPTAGAAIHETEPKVKKREYNPEVTNLVRSNRSSRNGDICRTG